MGEGGPRRLTAEELEWVRLPRRYWRATLDGVQEGVHKEVLARFLGDAKSMLAKGYGLFLWGKNGVGKTSIAAVIAKEVKRAGYSVYFVRAADYRDAVFSREMFDSEFTVRQRARDVDLLVLDDLGKEGKDASGSSERCYEDLVRGRVADMKSTIVTTNLTVEEFADPDVGGYRTSFLAVMRGSVLPTLVEGRDMREDDDSALVDSLTGGEG